MKYEFGFFSACLVLLGFSQVGFSADDRLDRFQQEGLNRALRHEACVGSALRVEALVSRGADVNGRAPFGETALSYAVLMGRVEVTLTLLRLGASPDASLDDQGRTPLLKAAQPCNYRAVQGLLKAGADVNHTDAAGKTALIYASEGGCVQSVAVLLAYSQGRSAVEHRDHSGRSALDYANHPFIVSMLEAAHGRSDLIELSRPLLGVP